jgi:Ca2+-binding RTX toxin-like protein
MRGAIARSRTRGLAGLVALVAIAGLAVVGATTAYAGPLVLMGIDMEDGGPGGHGDTQIYSDVLSGGVLTDTTNGGNGILVIGGGKDPSDDVTQVWDLIGTQTGEPITYVNGAANISAQSFAGFQALAVVSSEFETFDGGLTQAENDALAGRGPAIANFVNGGGGLFGLSQTGLTNTYAYMPDASQFTTNTFLSISDVEATPAGEAVGLNDTSLDICCWHDEYTAFPSYLTVLATNAENSLAVALGGEQVTLPENCTNGVDDDGDGLIDLADPNCQVAPAPYLESHCGFTINGKNQIGTDSNETLTGTPQRDRFKGRGGNDKIEGLEDPDCLFGNRGDDNITGDAGDDVIRGGRNADNVKGNAGADNIRGQEGSDDLKGGPGDDVIKAQGNKRQKNEGGIDDVDCGSGDDTVTADRWDNVANDCEKVKIVN